MDAQQERIKRFIGERYRSEPEYLWAKYPDYAVFRHPATQKWFAVFMRISGSKIGLSDEGVVSVLDIKCSPLMIGSLLSEKGFFPAYHMNKNNWISILLDESVPDDQVHTLLEFSYDSVAPKRRKRTLPTAAGSE